MEEIKAESNAFASAVHDHGSEPQTQHKISEISP